MIFFVVLYVFPSMTLRMKRVSFCSSSPLVENTRNMGLYPSSTSLSYRSGITASPSPRNPHLIDIPTSLTGEIGFASSGGSYKNTISCTCTDGISRASRSHLLCSSRTSMKSPGTKSFRSFILFATSVTSRPIHQNRRVVLVLRAILTRHDH